MLPDIPNPNRSYQGWEDFLKNGKGCWPQFHSERQAKVFAKGAFSYPVARKLGVFQAGRVWQNKKSDRKTICSSVYEVNVITVLMYIQIIWATQSRKNAPDAAFSLPQWSCGTGRLTMDRRSWHWSDLWEQTGQGNCYVNWDWLDIPGHLCPERAVLTAAWYLETASTSKQKGIDANLLWFHIKGCIKFYKRWKSKTLQNFRERLYKLDR